MSDIYGEGYGASHEWVRGYQPHGDRSTPYKCKKCGVEFRHWYNVVPNIHEAIREAGIPDKCGQS